jgi:hypothetical protein
MKPDRTSRRNCLNPYDTPNCIGQIVIADRVTWISLPLVDVQKTAFLHWEQPDGAHCGQKSECSGDENEAGGAVIDEVLFFMTFEGGVEQLFLI